MIVECQNCSTRFQLDDSRVPARGIRVRCSRCKEAFFLQHPSDSGSEALHDVVSATTASGGAPPDATQDLEPGAAVESPAVVKSSAEAEEEDWEFSDDFPGFSDDDADHDEDDEAGEANVSLADSSEASASPLDDSFSSDADDDGLDLGGFADADDPTVASASPVDSETAPDAVAGSSADSILPADVAGATAAAEVVAADPQGGIDFGDLEQASSLELDGSDDPAPDAPAADIPRGSSMEDQAASLADAPSGDFDAAARSEFGEAGDFSAAAGASVGEGEASAAAGSEGLDASSLLDDDDADDWNFFSDESSSATGSTVIGAMGVAQATDAAGQASGTPVGPRMETSGKVAGAGRRALLSTVGNALGWGITASLIGLALAWGLLDVPSATYRVPSIVDLGDFHAEQVRGRWVENAQMGRVYVVSGRLVNDSGNIEYPGSLEVALLGRNGARLEMEATPVGLPLDTALLRELAPDALEQSAAMSVRALGATAVSPDAALAFETVFLDLPDDASSFVVQMREYELPTLDGSPNALAGR